MSTTLVLGGQRSGKSAYAEALLASAPAKVYLATSEIHDDEMAIRVAAHQGRRDATWTTIEEPLDLVSVLQRENGPVLVDCLSLWLSNLFGAGRAIATETDALATGLTKCPGDVVLVSSEVGLGIIPDNALARAYGDALGTLNQRIAQVADRVVLVTAGLPHILKDTR